MCRESARLLDMDTTKGQPGRPRKDRQTINCTLPRDVVTRLANLAQQENTTRSDLIERALRQLTAS